MSLGLGKFFTSQLRISLSLPRISCENTECMKWAEGHVAWGPFLSTLSSSVVNILSSDPEWSIHEVFLFYGPKIFSQLSKSLVPSGVWKHLLLPQSVEQWQTQLRPLSLDSHLGSPEGSRCFHIFHILTLLALPAWISKGKGTTRKRVGCKRWTNVLKCYYS